MKGGIGDLMKKVQQAQADMQRVQEEIAEMTVEGQSGAGLVKVEMNGQHHCLGVRIDAKALDDDKDMLEDLIAAAINDASNRIAEQSRQQLADATAGMGLPPGMKLPF